MWAGWKRPGIPQASLGHTFLRAPQAARGARSGRPATALGRGCAPGGLRKGGIRRIAPPGDVELHAIICHRPVLEGILRQAVEAEPTVDLRCGCDVVGLVAREPSRLASIPSVAWVPEEPSATAGWRQGRSWVASGQPLPRYSAGCRAHRRPGRRRGVRRAGVGAAHRGSSAPCSDPEKVTPRLNGAHGRPTQPLNDYEICGADRVENIIIKLAPPSLGSRAARAPPRSRAPPGCRGPCRSASTELDDERSTPIGPVAAMGRGRAILLQQQPSIDGRPIALNLQRVIGDTRCQTNSHYAWGSGNMRLRAQRA